MTAGGAALAESPALAAFAAAFEALRAQPEFAPTPELREARERAWSSVQRRGLPTTRDEAWRATSIAPIAAASFRRADDGLAQRLPEALLARLGFAGAFRGREAVFVNGRFAPRLSSLDALAGVRVRCLRHALRDEPQGAASRLGALVPSLDAHPFAALNTALFEDGALVEVEPGAQMDAPLHLLHISWPGEGASPALSLPRVLLRAGRGSRVRLVETYGGHPGQPALVDAVTEIELEDDAQLDRTKLQRESDSAFHVALLAVRQGRDARFVDHSISVGAALSRHDIDVLLDGEGAECVLDGLFLAEGAQHTDTHSRIDHARPHGTSRELYKGVLDGRARGVFHGLVVVREGAQKSDAWQANRNLLLSTQALVHSTPQLEIRADDVKCKHGSTTGQLDPQALFYLRSRGLGEEAARALLTWAFASEIVQRLEVEPVRARLSDYLHERLPLAPREEVA